MNRVKDMVIVVAFLAAIMFAAGGFAFQTPSVEIDAADAAEPSEAPSVKQTPEPTTETVAESPAASAEATPTPEPVEEEPPYSETDAEMLAKVIWAEARGIPSDAEKAAVAWCALNRLDAGTWGETLSDVLTAPHQFAYRESSPVTGELKELAFDVLERWWAEKNGETDVGRTLPADYYFFDGDGANNHFRQQYAQSGSTWDWSLPDPYEEGGQ